MLRRSFSILPRTLKHQDKTLKKAIKYISEEQTLKSLIARKEGDETKYVEEVVNLLNSSLPDVKKHQKTMDVHYTMLMEKLRGMVDREVVYASVDISKKINDCRDGDSLFNLIWELQMDPMLREKATLKHYYHIITNPKFTPTRCLELLDCLDLVKTFKLDLKIMAIYKLNNPKIVQKYLDDLINSYFQLTQFSQKLTLRILQRESKMDYLIDRQGQSLRALKNNHSQVVMIFQTLHQHASKLPYQLIEDAELTVLQKSFCESITLFSEYCPSSLRLSKLSSQLVKASLINKLSHCNTETEHSININEYKFKKFLEETLEDCMQMEGLGLPFYASCSRTLEKLRKEYSTESQLSLRLV